MQFDSAAITISFKITKKKIYTGVGTCYNVPTDGPRGINMSNRDITEDEFMDILFDPNKEVTEKHSSFPGVHITTLYDFAKSKILAIREITSFGVVYYIP